MRAERVFAHLFADVHAFQNIDFRELRIVTAADDCVFDDGHLSKCIVAVAMISKLSATAV